MPTCWDSSPEKCSGCHYCQTARDTDTPTYPLSPLEAHRRDQADADLRQRAADDLAAAELAAHHRRRVERMFATQKER